MSTDPVDLDAIERIAAGSHDPVMALQTRALVAEVRRLRGELVVLGADRDILDQKDSAHEGELGDLRAKLSAADAEVDELRRVADAARRWLASISMTETTAEADLVLALNALDGEKAVWVREEDDEPETPGSRDDREPPYHFGEMEPR